MELWRELGVALAVSLWAPYSGNWLSGLILGGLLFALVLLRLQQSRRIFIRSVAKGRRPDLEKAWEATWRRMLQQAGLTPDHCQLVVYNGVESKKHQDFRGLCCGYGQHMAILVTSQTLEGPYALGVLAHEIAHAKGQHVLKNQVVLAFTYLFGVSCLFALGGYLDNLELILVAIPYFVGMEWMRASLQKRFEFQADRYSEHRYPGQLRRALDRDLHQKERWIDQHPSNERRINRLAQ